MNRLPTAECIVNAPGNVYGIALEPPMLARIEAFGPEYSDGYKYFSY